METKLSFIVPVYNVEAFLPQCLDSILSQSTTECEIILVDDGATDGSGAICDSYAEKYDRVKVIHKSNGGLSSARNAGMKAAVGKYVCFVDADDYIAPGSVAELLAWIGVSCADIVFLQCDKVYPDGTTEPMADGISAEGIRNREREAVLDFLSSCSKFPGYAWAKLWRREFLTGNGLAFPDDRRLSEDLGYCLDGFLAAESFDALEFPFYRYRQSREGSITSTVNERLYFDTALFVTETAKRFPAPADTPSACALSFAAYEYAILLWQHRFLEGEARSKALRFLKEYRWLLRHGRSAKTRMVRLAAGILGIRGAAGLLNAYLSRR